MSSLLGRYHFNEYVLDLDQGRLTRGEDELPLRPKTFAVLRYLIEQTGRLVSKDELFANVWPNVTVTDDALVQSISELRRVLGENGARLISTVPRRGYRFEGQVTHEAAAPGGVAPTFVAAPQKQMPSRWFSRRVQAVAALVALAVMAAAWLSLDRGIDLVSATFSSAGVSKIAEAKPVVAVLPFGNQGDDPARRYFADGMTQDIISALGRFADLTVMSWNAVLPYRDKPVQPGDVTRSLGARYQVEGSVQQTGQRVRVNAQLVAGDGRVLWTATFDEALVELFALQDKIATQIAGALAIRVSQAEQRRVSAKPPANLEAYDYVLRARPALQRPARATMVEARENLRRAIELDPSYAAAYAALAETFFVGVSMGWAESPTEFLGFSEDLAAKALSLDEADVRARVVLGRIHIFYHRYEQAKTEMDRAIALNPSDANALAGRGNILMWSGETDAAIEFLERAQRIDPELNPLDRFALSLANYLKGRYAAAAEQAELNLRKTGGANFSRVILAAAYAQQNRQEELARAVSTIRAVDPTFNPQEFGTKFLTARDLEHLREGLSKAGLLTNERTIR